MMENRRRQQFIEDAINETEWLWCKMDKGDPPYIVGITPDGYQTWREEGQPPTDEEKQTRREQLRAWFYRQLTEEELER